MVTNETITKALALYGIEVTKNQVEKVKDLIAKTKFRPKTIIKLLSDPVLETVPLEDRLYAIEQLEPLNVSASTLKKFVEIGYSPSQFVELIRYARETVPPVSDFAERPSGFVSNLKNILGYDNLIFLDKLSGFTHDSIMINGKLNEIGEAMETASLEYGMYNNMGIAEVLYKIREEYANAEKRNEPITFPYVLQKALNSIIPNLDQSSLGDDVEQDMVDSLENILDRD